VRRGAESSDQQPALAPYTVRQPSAPQADRPRVVHAIANFRLGGSSRLVVDLIEQLGGEYEQEVVTGFLPSPPAYVGLAIREFRFRDSPKPLLAYLSKFRPRLLHVHFWGDVDLPWYLQVFEAGRRYGCTIVENVNTPVAPFVANWVRRYVFVSEYVQREFGRSLPHGEVIHPGSNFELFSRAPDVQPADGCIGMVYRLEPDKLNERAIDVFIETARRRPGTHALIVGGGSLKTGFQRAVSEAGLRAKFEFTGFVRYEDLPALYGRMSVFVAPVWKESFGQVSSFAMSMGLPVVGYDVGALAEIIADRELLAPPGDSAALATIIARLLDDRDRRVEIGRRNQRRAYEMFSVETMIRRYRQLYRELIDTSP
jgi:glycosyltransferase involved in cell wall biosynthesis